MLFKGKKIKGPANSIIVIPRGDEDFVFTLQTVLDFSEFEAIVKEPKPPMVQMRGQEVAVPNFQDPKFKEAFIDYHTKQTTFMILKSLEATTDLKFETIVMSDPSTWTNFEKEMVEAGFTRLHINRIVNEVMAVNGLDDKKIDEAKARFLAMKPQVVA